MNLLIQGLFICILLFQVKGFPVKLKEDDRERFVRCPKGKNWDREDWDKKGLIKHMQFPLDCTPGHEIPKSQDVPSEPPVISTKPPTDPETEPKVPALLEPADLPSTPPVDTTDFPRRGDTPTRKSPPNPDITPKNRVVRQISITSSIIAIIFLALIPVTDI